MTQISHDLRIAKENLRDGTISFKDYSDIYKEYLEDTLDTFEIIRDEKNIIEDETSLATEYKFNTTPENILIFLNEIKGILYHAGGIVMGGSVIYLLKKSGKPPLDIDIWLSSKGGLQHITKLLIQKGWKNDNVDIDIDPYKNHVKIIYSEIQNFTHEQYEFKVQVMVNKNVDMDTVRENFDFNVSRVVWDPRPIDKTTRVLKEELDIFGDSEDEEDRMDKYIPIGLRNNDRGLVTAINRGIATFMPQRKHFEINENLELAWTERSLKRLEKYKEKGFTIRFDKEVPQITSGGKMENPIVKFLSKRNLQIALLEYYLEDEYKSVHTDKTFWKDWYVYNSKIIREYKGMHFKFGNDDITLLPLERAFEIITNAEYLA